MIARRHAPLVAVVVLAAAALAAFAPSAARAQSFATYVDGPWGQIHVRVAGHADAPTVVLLHGIVWSSDQFGAAQDSLAARGIRSLAVDLPGYGASAAPRRPPTIEQYAEALVPVLQRLGPGPVDVLAVDASGAIAVALAGAHPDRVRRIVLEGPPLFDAVDRARYYGRPRAWIAPRADGRHLQSFWQAQADAQGARLSQDALQSIQLAVYRAGAKGWFVQDAAYAWDFAAALGRVRAPVVLLTYAGQPFDRAARQLASGHPAYRLVSLDWSGTAASFDRPEAWADAVASIASSQH